MKLEDPIGQMIADLDREKFLTKMTLKINGAPRLVGESAAARRRQRIKDELTTKGDA